MSQTATTMASGWPMNESMLGMPIMPRPTQPMVILLEGETAPSLPRTWEGINMGAVALARTPARKVRREGERGFIGTPLAVTCESRVNGALHTTQTAGMWREVERWGGRGAHWWVVASPK